MKSIVKQISRFDLSPTQAKIYVFLTKNNPKNLNEISKFLKLPKAKTYRHLNHLQNKGIIIANSKKPIKFEAIPFEKAVQILVDVKKSRINQLENEISYMISQWNMIPYGESYKGFPAGSIFEVQKNS